MLTTGMTIAEALLAISAARPDREALVCDDSRITYRALAERSIALARGLAGLGIGTGDRIVAELPPGVDFATLFFAAAGLGAVMAPLDPQGRPQGIAGPLRDAAPVALVTHRDPRPVVPEAASLRHLIGASEPAGLPLTLEALIADGRGRSDPLPPVSSEDVVALLYTSGSTGTPKGAMHSHRSLIASVVATIKIRELWLKRPSLATIGQTVKALARYRERLLRAAGRPQTFLSTVPWHTITGLDLMLQVLLMGDRMVLMPHFHPRAALQLIAAERVTILIAVPTALQAMLALPDLARYDTSSLLVCGTGAAPCPPELARAAQARLGCAMYIAFGATETGGPVAVTSLTDSVERQAETVGRPVPGQEVRIVDDARQELPAGQVGEIACRGDTIMIGYLNAPETTAQVLDQDGWYYTGDLGWIDDQGYLRIAGRKKDLIIRGGRNIYPVQIEAYLAAHPAIQEAAVVGVPSQVGGENVWAFVRPVENAELTAQAVLDYCRQGLEAYQIPAQVRIVAGFPRSDAGKLQKFRLREAALEEMKRGETP